MTRHLVSILLVGDSHAAGYNPSEVTLGKTRAVLSSTYILAAQAVRNLVVTYDDGRRALNPLLTNALAGWPGLNVKGQPLTPDTIPHKQLVLSLGASAYACNPTEPSEKTSHLQLFRGDVDFFLPDHPDLPVDPACSLLPVALVRDLFAPMLAPLRTALSQLTQDYGKRLWVLGAPPPPPDNTVKRNVVVKLYAGGVPDQVRLAPPFVALKAWFLVTAMVKDICRETNCHFIDCAEIACDSTGFLKQEFALDGFHGNAAYCQEMTRHILFSVLKSMAPD